jgi:hypothetical protein
MGLGGFLYRHGGRQIYKGSGDVYDHVNRRFDDLSGKTAAKEAAKAQMDATDKSIGFQREMFDKSQELNRPWREAGITALSDLAGGLKSGAFDAPDEKFNYQMPEEKFNYQMPEEAYTAPKFDFKADPGYQFRQAEQQKAIERSAAAGGGLFAGATLSDLAKRSGEMASQEYGNAYERYDADRGFGYNAFRDKRADNVDQRNFAYGAFRDRGADSIDRRNFAYGSFNDAQGRKRSSLNVRFSRLSSLAGLGDAATGRDVTGARGLGDSISQSIQSGGNAQAAGIVGGYNSQRDTAMGIAGLVAKYYGGK